MDRKSRREIARKIAKLENIIENSSSEEEKNKAMSEINSMSMNDWTLEDMMAIDEMIIKILEKKLTFKNFSDIITL